MEDVINVMNAYGGLGGNRKKWPDNVRVTMIEMEPDIAEVYQAHNPDDIVIIGDAKQYILDHHHEYDAVWASPPCPTHSAMQLATRHKVECYPDMTLYQIITFLKHRFKGKWWVAENVKPYYEPWITPQMIDRHAFWASFHIPSFKMDRPKNFIDSVSQQVLKDWLGIQYEGNIYYGDNHCPNQVLRNCVHPDLGLHVFESATQVNPSTIDQLALI